MITIRVKIDEAQGLSAFLANITPVIERTVDNALDQSAAAVLSHLRAGFLAETDPTGKKWTPSVAGLRRKAKGTGQTLFMSGRLFRSIQLYSDGRTRSISTDVPYAGWLQNHHTVPRTILALTPAHIQLTTSIFKNRLKGMFRE